MIENEYEVLGFDLGTRVGWARGRVIGDRLSDMLSGWEHLRQDRHAGGGMRFLRFERWLGEMLAGKSPAAVFYEEVRRHAGTDAAHVYGGLLAILTATCERRGIPYAGLPVGTIKKFATGKGNADKTAMLNAARKLPGCGRVIDDNEADAIHIMRLGLQEMNCDLGEWK